MHLGFNYILFFTIICTGLTMAPINALKKPEHLHAPVSKKTLFDLMTTYTGLYLNLLLNPLKTQKV